MNQQFKKWAVMFAMTTLGSLAVQAQGDGGPLVEALVKKGVLSSQEGEEIRASMLEDNGSTAGGMLSWGSSAVKGVKLYGDARVRYQYDNQVPQNSTGSAAGDDRSRSRYRYRLRLGADYQFAENWKSGVRLETSNESTSTNTNFGGYFDKSEDSVFVGLVYLEYEINNPELFGFSPADYFDLRMGKHLQPFYVNGVNGFWWDSDTNPEGFSEQLGWKSVAGVDKFDITLRGGQYITSSNDNGGTTSANQALENDQFLFMSQLEGKYEWASKSGLTVAPTFMAQTGGYLSGTGATIPTVAQTTELQDLLVFILPAEVYFNVAERPLSIFGTFGINVADDRTGQAAGVAGGSVTSRSEQPIFFNAGAKYGQIKKKGDFEISGEYRYIEQGSANPFLMDSDFGNIATSFSGINFQGPVFSAAYNFTDNINGRVTYFNASNIDQTSTINGAGTLGNSQLLQVDLSWKF